MAGSSAADKGGPRVSQAKMRIAVFTLAGLLACVLALGFAAGRSLSEESAACKQYGCADEPAPTQTVLTEDSNGPNSGSASASTSASASASASVTASAIAAEAGGVAEVDTPAVIDPVASASASASASAGSEEEMPADRSAPTASFPSEDAVGIGESEEPDVAEQPSSKEPTTSKRPVDGYPYDGKPCEDRYCEIEGVDGPVECASYETAAGEEVYGCANPNTYEKKGCYEVTFYTAAGKPYNNMDTCSGEKVYAPPEPPKGAFRYWDPPDDPRYPLDIYGHAVEECVVGGPLSRRDPYCGLKGSIPKNYECQVYYDTAYGTIRGCAPAADMNDYYHERPTSCAEEGLHLYDEAGREIGTANLCPKVRNEECKTARCGQPVPQDWSCRREHYNFGELYGGERRTLTRCADPLLEDFLSRDVPVRECKGELLGVLYDERGREIKGEQMTCSHGGSGSDMAEWAGFDAAAAEDVLDGGNGGTPSEPGGGSTGGPANAPPFAVMGTEGAADNTQSDSEDAPGTASGESGRQEEHPAALAALYRLLTGNDGAPPGAAAPAGAPDSGSTITSVRDFTARALPLGIAHNEAGSNETEENANARVETKVWENVASEEVAAVKQVAEGSDQSGGAAVPTKRKASESERETKDAFRSALAVSAAPVPSEAESRAAVGGSAITADSSISERSGMRTAAVGWGGALDRAQTAAVQSVRDGGGFDWLKAAVAVLGVSGGVLIIRRRLSG